MSPRAPARRPTFRIAGIPVRVEPSFFVVVGLFALFVPDVAALVLWVVLVSASVLVHELGHALAFRAFGSPAEIRLHGMGGLTAGQQLPPARNLVVSLAGPLAGIVVLGLPALVLAASGVGNRGPVWETALHYAVLINIFWSLVNLLPILPLDGGNVVCSLLELAGHREAERTTRVLSVVSAGAVAVAGLALGLPVVVLLAGFALVINVTGLNQDRARVRSAAVVAAQRALAGGDAWGAVQAAEPVVVGDGAPLEKAAACDVQAWAWLLAGDLVNTQAALSRRPAQVPPSPLLDGALALALGQRDRGLGVMAYGLVHTEPGPEHLFATDAVARAGQVPALADQLLVLDGGAGVPAVEHLATILHHRGRFAEAAALASRLYLAHPVDPAGGCSPRAVWAYNAACSLARGGWLDDSVGWLRVAVEAGWDDLDRLRSDPDLAVVRSSGGYAAVERQLAGAPGR